MSVPFSVSRFISDLKLCHQFVFEKKRRKEGAKYKLQDLNLLILLNVFLIERNVIVGYIVVYIHLMSRRLGMLLQGC